MDSASDRNKMPLQVPRLRKGCFCFTLRTGSLIIGYFSMALSLLILSATSFFIYQVAQFVRKNKSRMYPQHSPEELARLALGIHITQACYLLVYLFHFTINVVLVIGAHKENARLLRIYVSVGWFLFGMELALFVVSTVFIGALATLPLLKWCLFHFYCLLIVRSTYLEIEDRNRLQDVEMRTVYTPQQIPYTHQQAPLITN
ncbi:hypothetical protein ACJJTC_006214 [Scirpophaga incertulas]